MERQKGQRKPKWKNLDNFGMWNGYIEVPIYFYLLCMLEIVQAKKKKKTFLYYIT